MIRPRSIILAVLSLMFFVAFAFLWMDSYRVAHDLGRFSSDGTRGSFMQIANGSLGFARITSFDEPDPDRRGWKYEQENPPQSLEDLRLDKIDRQWRFLGIYFTTGRDLSIKPLVEFRLHMSVLVVPLWLLLILMLPWTLTWLRLARDLRRWRRARRGLCTRCGYDLRGTPDRCPECGQDTDHALSPARRTLTSH